MDVDRIVVNGGVFQEGEFLPLDVGICRGRIVAIGTRGAFANEPDAAVIDASGKLVFPAAIDSHYHSRAPSQPEREDFTSATAAAAAGGVTTIIEMPISVPPATNGTVVRARADLALRDGHVYVGFYASSATLSRDDLVGSMEAGALAFKAFLQHVPPGREEEFSGLCLASNGELAQAFRLLAEFDLPCVFHAEDESIYSRLEAELRSDGRRDGPAHAESRPDYVEAISVRTLLRLAERFNVHLHVPHVSSGMTVALIREARARGVRVTAETCPHYLQFDASALARLGPYAKCNPPFKASHDIDAVWQGVLDGTNDTVASDHSPFTVEEKERARDDIWLGPPGFPVVEVLVPFAVGAALEGRITWRRLNELIFANPARIFGLWPRKGVIRPGTDADLMIYDPSARGVFDHRTLHSKTAETAVIWDGIARAGAVCLTLLRGEVVYREGEVVGAAGRGQRLRRRDATAWMPA